MDLFATMTTFVQVVRKSSFTTAARSIGISRALVSRHVAELEQRLGTRLLVRTTRSVSLTEAGQDYYDFCSRLLGEVANTEKMISGRTREAEGSLSVIVPKWIGSLDVADAVAAFCLEYPRIIVDLVLGGMSPKTYDFLERGFDVALQTREIADSQVKVKRIATIRYVMAATPALLERHPPILDPRDLHHTPCVTQSGEGVWSFAHGTELQRVKVQAAFASNTYLVLRKAMLSSLGVGMLPHHMVQQDIERGALVAVLPDVTVPDRPLYAAFAPGGAPPAKVRCFTNFLTSWFRSHPLD